MKNVLILTLCALSLCANIYARTGISLPQKDSKVFVTSTVSKVCLYGSKDLNKWGYWKTVGDKNDADFVVDYKVRKTWLPSFLTRNLKGYAEITNAKTGEVVYTSKKANSYWTILGFNHRKTIVRKLDRHIERNID